MAREIKFRAWLSGQGRYVGVDAIDFDEDSIRINDEYFFLADLEQYAGLTDKNDEEIYEGDIVRCYDHKNKVSFKGIVEFMSASFFINTPSCSHFRWTDYEVEIIGNIHENPELLGGE